MFSSSISLGVLPFIIGHFKTMFTYNISSVDSCFDNVCGSMKFLQLISTAVIDALHLNHCFFFRFSATTETTARSSKYGHARQRRRKHHLPIISRVSQRWIILVVSWKIRQVLLFSRAFFYEAQSLMGGWFAWFQASSFSSITDSTMSLNIITVTLNMGSLLTSSLFTFSHLYINIMYVCSGVKPGWSSPLAHDFGGTPSFPRDPCCVPTTKSPMLQDFQRWHPKTLKNPILLDILSVLTPTERNI